MDKAREMALPIIARARLIVGFSLMEWGQWEKGYENVPHTPHTRLIATWIWDMITFTLEMTFNQASLSQATGVGMACASLHLQNLKQTRYKAIDMDRFRLKLDPSSINGNLCGLRKVSIQTGLVYIPDSD